MPPVRFLIRLTLCSLLFFSLFDNVQGRYRWMERGDRPVALHPRRFGQEHPSVIDKLSNACGGGVCATLAGQAITPLLAAQPECSQQDMADLIIDTAQSFDDATKATLITLAKEYRQAEKNTPPDFTTNPPVNRNSVFCQKAPKNQELRGLVQAQDPANDPNTFFDPATKASVKKGAQANTFPSGSSNLSPSRTVAFATVSISVIPSAKSTRQNLAASTVDAPSVVSECPLPVTVTVTGPINPLPTGPAVTVTFGSSIPLIPVPTSTAYVVGNFGSCTLPQIEFGVGFDNRKETSFQPADKSSFNHESAQNIDIITQFICDTLVNSCGADQTAQDTCTTAKTAADQFPVSTGAQADAFNAVFGLSTAFAQIPAVDTNGNVVPGTTTDGSGGISVSSIATPSVAASTTALSSAQAAPTPSSPVAPELGNFGSCSVPQIEFGAGFDGRKETSFQPTDKTSYNHGSAQAIDTISQFICDALTNSCKADQAAKDTCAKAQAAADGQSAETGAQADAFNAAFGIRTNFVNVVVIDDQGRVVSGGSTDVANPAPADSADAAVTSTTIEQPVVTSTPAGGNLQTFAGALGGVAPPSVTALANGQFQVDGNSAFQDLSSALTRSCDVQHNQCANAANTSGNQGDLTVAACGDQQNQCNASH